MRRVRILREPEEIRRAWGDGALLLVVYHRGHRVRTRKIDQGFQPTPYRCRRCGRWAMHPNALRYEIARFR